MLISTNWHLIFDVFWYWSRGAVLLYCMLVLVCLLSFTAAASLDLSSPIYLSMVSFNSIYPFEARAERVCSSILPLPPSLPSMQQRNINLGKSSWIYTHCTLQYYERVTVGRDGVVPHSNTVEDHRMRSLLGKGGMTFQRSSTLTGIELDSTGSELGSCDWIDRYTHTDRHWRSICNIKLAAHLSMYPHCLLKLCKSCT